MSLCEYGSYAVTPPMVGLKGIPMLIADDRYFALVKSLTDLDQDQCPFSIATARRIWIETQIQDALCVANVYPASCADCDPDHPSIVLHGDEPSAELVAEIGKTLVGLGDVSVH